MDDVREAYLRLHRSMWRALLAYCGDTESADQVVVDAFRSLPDRKPVSAQPDELLWSDALSRAAAMREQEAPDPSSTDGEDLGPVLIVDPEGAPELYRTPEPYEELSLRLQRLDDATRAVVALHVVADLGIDEVATVLSTTPGAVADRRQEAVHELNADPADLVDLVQPLREVEPTDLWPRIDEAANPTVVERLRGLTPVSGRSVMALGFVAAALFWLASPGVDPLRVRPSTEPVTFRSGVTVMPETSSDEAARGSTNPNIATVGSTAEPLNLVAGENGAAIFDLRLSSGERFRLSVPARLRPELDTFVPRRPPGGLDITGPSGTTIRINFNRCPSDLTLAATRDGSLVGRTADPDGDRDGAAEHEIVFCRPGELLSARVVTDVDLTVSELETFDVRTIELGTAYVEHVRRMNGIAETTGPLVFESTIVTTTGDSVTAVHGNNLTKQWAYDLPPGSTGRLTLLDPAVAVTDPVIGGRARHDIGVWISDSENGIVNVDPSSGAVRWVSAFAGRVGGVRGHRVDGPWYVWSSFNVEGDNRAPRLARIDPDSGVILWQVEGRQGADWGWDPLITTGDQVVIVDVFTDVESSADGEGNMVWAFDAETGAPDFTVGLDAPEGMFTPDWLVQVAETGHGPTLLTLTSHGLLTRIELTGAVLWSTRINPGVLLGQVELTDGTVALRARSSPVGPFYLDIATGERIAEAAFTSPPSDCEVQYGPTAWATLWWGEDLRGASDDETGAGRRPPSCVVVGEHQALQIWNKGFEPMVVTWQGQEIPVASDDFIDVGLVGGALAIGPSVFEVEPYADLTVWVMAVDARPTKGFTVSDGVFGPISVGMTVDEAAEALAPDNRLIDLATGRIGCVVIEADPYSPLFRVEQTGSDRTITSIGRRGVMAPDPSSFCR